MRYQKNTIEILEKRSQININWHLSLSIHEPWILIARVVFLLQFYRFHQVSNV